MKVFVDDNALDLRSGAAKEEILREVLAACASRGRVLETISVDGVVLDEASFVALEGGSRVEVSTVSLRDLIRSSLQEAVGYLPKLVRGLGTVADRFEAEEKAQALPTLSDALEGIGWLLRVLADTHALLGARPAEGEELARLLAALQERLEKLSRALEGDRFFEAAFLLREEIVPALEGLAPRIEVLRSLSEGNVN